MDPIMHLQWMLEGQTEMMNALGDEVRVRVRVSVRAFIDKWRSGEEIDPYRPYSIRKPTGRS